MRAELLLLISFTAIITVCCSGKSRSSAGLIDGKLSKCPDTPNCVSSTAAGSGHFIEPLYYSSDTEKAMNVLLDTVRSFSRTEIITVKENYIHAEFRSLIFRFTDDVEFLADPAAKKIDLRSASRTGSSDLGVNRKRIERIRKVFNEKMALIR